MTKEAFLKVPPIEIDGEGGFTGMVYVGQKNVYAVMRGTHSDNFIILTPLREDKSWDMDVEATEWVELGDSVDNVEGPEGELL